MNYSEEDIQQMFKIMEEDREKRLLSEQLLNLSLNPDDQNKEEVVTQDQKNQKEPTQNSQDQNMIRTKREKLREELRKEEQESKFKLKRVIVPLVKCKEVDQSQEQELCSLQKEEQFGDQEDNEKNEKDGGDQEAEKPKKRQRRRR